MSLPARSGPRITKIKDGRTHLAHEVEYGVDMKTGAVLAVTVQGADQGATRTIASNDDRSGQSDGTACGRLPIEAPGQ